MREEVEGERCKGEWRETRGRGERDLDMVRGELGRNVGRASEGEGRKEGREGGMERGRKGR